MGDFSPVPGSLFPDVFQRLLVAIGRHNRLAIESHDDNDAFQPSEPLLPVALQPLPLISSEEVVNYSVGVEAAPVTDYKAHLLRRDISLGSPPFRMIGNAKPLRSATSYGEPPCFVPPMSTRWTQSIGGEPASERIISKTALHVKP